MSVNPICVTDLNFTQLEKMVQAMGETSYRARQVQHWVYRRLALGFEEMTDLPQAFRQRLVRDLRLHNLTALNELTGHDGTVKVLLALADGKTIESTLMRYRDNASKTRNTICISTQVGCPIGCPFCATGQQGFERNLTPGEIIGQVLYFARYLRDRCGQEENESKKPVNHITNLVFMGMGEPLANYDSLWQAIEMLNSPRGFGLGARNMVVSTSGLVPQIERLSQEKLQVGLAVSLHASDNALRDRLVPLNQRFPLEQVISACRRYVAATGRRPSFEYALFNGINDSLSQALSLVRLLKGLNCHVNLIPANRTASQTFRPSPVSAILAFEGELKRRHIACTLREPRGQDIDAGCGQLRSRYEQKARSKTFPAPAGGESR